MQFEDDALEAGEAFTRLLMQNQRRFQGLILSLVPNGPDADDILQESCAVMWRKFSEFQPGSDFAAWGLRVCRYQVMKYYSRQKREKARLSEETINAVTERLSAVEQTQLVTPRSKALERCREKLTAVQQETLRLRYDDKRATKEIAEEMNSSVDAIYKRLNRIHRQLLECVAATLSMEARPS